MPCPLLPPPFALRRTRYVVLICGFVSPLVQHFPPSQGRDLVSWRLNMGIHQAKLDNLDNIALEHSLGTIRAAKTQLHLLTANNSTPTVLASQIRFCDVLLREIQAIRSGLEDRMRCRGVIRRRSVVARRIRSSRRAAASRAKRRSR